MLEFLNAYFGVCAYQPSLSIENNTHQPKKKKFSESINARENLLQKQLKFPQMPIALITHD